jgi:hypothetical protein
VQDELLIAIREIRSGRFRRDSIITWLDAILKNKIKIFWRTQNYRCSLFTSIEPASAGIHDSIDPLSPGRTHTECRVNVSGVRLVNDRRLSAKKAIDQAVVGHPHPWLRRCVKHRWIARRCHTHPRGPNLEINNPARANLLALAGW